MDLSRLSVVTSMTLTARAFYSVEGHVAAEPLIERLEALFRDNEAFIVAARHDREERNMNQYIREEQDRAFQETLRQDQVIDKIYIRILIW